MLVDESSHTRNHRHDLRKRYLAEFAVIGLITLEGWVRKAGYRDSVDQFWPEWDPQNAALEQLLSVR